MMNKFHLFQGFKCCNFCSCSIKYSNISILDDDTKMNDQYQIKDLLIKYFCGCLCVIIYYYCLNKFWFDIRRHDLFKNCISAHGLSRTTQLHFFQTFRIFPTIYFCYLLENINAYFRRDVRFCKKANHFVDVLFWNYEWQKKNATKRKEIWSLISI